MSSENKQRLIIAGMLQVIGCISAAAGAAMALLGGWLSRTSLKVNDFAVRQLSNSKSFVDDVKSGSSPSEPDDQAPEVKSRNDAV